MPIRNSLAMVHTAPRQLVAQDRLNRLLRRILNFDRAWAGHWLEGDFRHGRVGELFSSSRRAIASDECDVTCNGPITPRAPTGRHRTRDSATHYTAVASPWSPTGWMEVP